MASVEKYNRERQRERGTFGASAFMLWTMLCIWSHKPDPGTALMPLASGRALPESLPVCPAHEQQVRAYLARAERDRTKFFVMMFLSMFSALAPVFTESSIGLAVPLLMLGAALVAFPFATPSTVSSNGIARSMQLVKGLGAVLLAAGVVFLYLGIS